LQQPSSSVYDEIVAKSCDWKAEKLRQTLKAAKFTGDAISITATVVII
jgi:hypothetical protein